MSKKIPDTDSRRARMLPVCAFMSEIPLRYRMAAKVIVRPERKRVLKLLKKTEAGVKSADGSINSRLTPVSQKVWEIPV